MDTGDSYLELLRRYYGRFPEDNPAKQMLQAVSLFSKMHELGIFVDKLPLSSESYPVPATA